MPSLAGQHALIIGDGHPHANMFHATLIANGATVALVAADATPSIALDVDILVICAPAIAAGVSVTGAVSEVVGPAESWASRFAASRQSSGGSGVIVHVTGLAGLGCWPGWEAASVAYGALHSLVRSTAVALAPYGIRVNALVPGVDERLAREIAVATGLPLDDVRMRIPVQRFMPERALANALLYLVHESASYVSGEMLVVDGGWDIWGRLSAVAT